MYLLTLSLYNQVHKVERRALSSSLTPVRLPFLISCCTAPPPPPKGFWFVQVFLFCLLATIFMLLMVFYFHSFSEYVPIIAIFFFRLVCSFVWPAASAAPKCTKITKHVIWCQHNFLFKFRRDWGRIDNVIFDKIVQCCILKRLTYDQVDFGFFTSFDILIEGRWTIIPVGQVNIKYYPVDHIMLSP